MKTPRVLRVPSGTRLAVGRGGSFARMICPYCGKAQVRVAARKLGGGFAELLEPHWMPGTAERCPIIVKP